MTDAKNEGEAEAEAEADGRGGWWFGKVWGKEREQGAVVGCGLVWIGGAFPFSFFLLPRWFLPPTLSGLSTALVSLASGVLSAELPTVEGLR